MNVNINWRKLGHVAPTYVVFGSAAYQSFWHSIHVAAAHSASDPWLLPISIDGVMIVAARYVTHARTKAARWLAGVVMGLGMAAMVVINYLAAPAGDIIGQAISVWPAVGMILTAALIHWAPQAPQKARKRPAARRPNNVTTMRRKTA